MVIETLKEIEKLGIDNYPLRRILHGKKYMWK